MVSYTRALVSKILIVSCLVEPSTPILLTEDKQEALTTRSIDGGGSPAFCVDEETGDFFRSYKVDLDIHDETKWPGPDVAYYSGIDKQIWNLGAPSTEFHKTYTGIEL
jgi:hypothetical protein